jgi:hypothetical protein
MTEPDKPTPSLYEWAGGEPAIRRLMEAGGVSTGRHPKLHLTGTR